jgi:hypothetical protein
MWAGGLREAGYSEKSPKVVVLLRFLPAMSSQAAEINEIGLAWPTEPITIHSSLQRIRPVGGELCEPVLIRRAPFEFGDPSDAKRAVT